MKRAAIAAAFGALALGAPVAPAQAFYGNGAAIVSASDERLEQADDATTFAAISADGRFVAFQTRARNFFADDDPDPAGEYRVGGIFRKSLDTGALELVAHGDVRDEATNDLLLGGARNPSISADGRYVAFATAESLVAADTNDAFDVYVRDMTLSWRAPGAYELISAKDGGDTPATYDEPVPVLPGRNPGGDVTRGVAISADGRRVVFRTIEVESDLPDRPSTTTAGYQVFVRDRVAKTTELVTRARVSDNPAGGAIGPAGISGDGTTAVWTGRNAGDQTIFLNGEFIDPNGIFYLWRRFADGPAATTRRITGAVDVDDPACPPGATVSTDPTVTGPCYGPLFDVEAFGASISSQLPTMSADGRRLAFLTGTGGRPFDGTSGAGLDLWVTDMSPGVSRKAGTVELTREGSGDSAASGQILGVAMSADGRWLAIATPRTRYLLPSLRVAGTMRQLPDTTELEVVDLESRTVERATRSVAGGEIAGDVLPLLSVSGDGGRIAFVAQTTNLFFGDANGQPDGFVATRQTEPVIEPPPPEPPPTPPAVIENPPDPPRLVIRTGRTSKRAVVLTVTVPGPGTLTAEAKGALARSAGKGKPKPKPKQVTFVRLSREAKKAGRVTLTMSPSKRFSADLVRAKSLSALTTVTFRPKPAGARLTGRVRVKFLPPPAKKKANPKSRWTTDW